MTRIILFVFVAIISSVNSYLIKVPTVLPDERIVPTAVIGRVHIQKLLLPLFEDVCEESTEPIVLRLSEEFQLNPKDGSYIDPTVIDNFITHRSSKGLLPRGEIFSEYDDDHMNELKIITEVLVNAENFDTFYKAACWARQNLNCGMFVDAIYLAIMRRRDTERVLLPALYEVLPNYFVRKDYIIKASTLVSGTDTSLLDVRNDGNSYIMDVNYTDNYFENSIEQMTYFNEDVDLNSYYFFNKLKMLKWLRDDTTDVNNRRGQYIYQMMKQLDSRYNLERYSIGLPEVDALDWDTDDQCIYDPMLIFSNGNDFSKRPMTISQNSDIILTLKNIEHSLTATVNQMRATGSDKNEIFNYVVDTLVTSESSYENIAMKLLSNLQTGITSVLGHYLTTLRDPIYWRLNKKILEIVDNNLNVLPPYETNELYFPGVEVTNIEIKKPSTSCDNYEFDVTDALRNKDIETNFQIKFNQLRLTNKPLSFKISISSLVMEKALIKIYIGPKLLPGQFTDRKNWFMQVDSFETNLKVGTNTITRTSNEMNNLSDGFITLGKIRKYIQDAEFGIDALPLRTVESQTGFPSRLLLPRGSSAPFQLFVFVAPFVKAVPGGARNYMQSNYDAILSPGYPMDLNIEIQDVFSLPNALVKDIVITHKSALPHSSENGGTNDWQKDYTEYRNGPTSLASSYAKSTNILSSKKFDYKSKSEKYGKKNINTKPNTNNNDLVNIASTKVENIDDIVLNNQPRVMDDILHPIEYSPLLLKSKNEKIVDGDKTVKSSDVSKVDKNKDSALTKKIESKGGKYEINADEMGSKTSETDYKRVVTIDKNVNNDYSKDVQDGLVAGRSDNVVIKHIESKDAKTVKNNDGIDTPIASNEYGRVVTIDKNVNNDYSKDIQDGQVAGRYDNIVIKHIESKDAKTVKNNDGIDTPIANNEYERVVTVDKNVNNDYSKNMQDGQVAGRSDNNLIIKHIDSKGGKSVVKSDIIPENDKVISIDTDIKTDRVNENDLNEIVYKIVDDNFGDSVIKLLKAPSPIKKSLF